MSRVSAIPKFHFATLALLVLLESGISTSGHAAEDETFFLDQAVQDRLLVLTKDYKPRVLLVKTVQTREINNRGNAGKLIHNDSKITYHLQDNGLWAMVSIGTMTGAVSGSGVGQTLSLCGIVTLLNVTASSNDLTTAASVPLGRSFAPFGIRSTIEFSRKLRVKSIEVSTNDICSPLPGAEFSYHLETEVQLKMSGLMSRTNVNNSRDEVSCKVAKESRPASDLAPQFRGEALEVSCARTVDSRIKIQMEYVFLREAGMYFLASEQAEVQTTRVQYKEAEYAQ